MHVDGRARFGVVWLCTTLLLTGCGGRTRTGPEKEEMVREYEAYRADVVAQGLSTRQKVVERVKFKYDAAQSGQSTVPLTVDILILSGGGDYGAFGAGFLKGWGSIQDPAFARPTFDAVSGVSTGALIAPFAYVGTEQAYDRILTLYRNPKNDWVTTSGLFFFMPGNESLMTIKGLRRDVEHEIDKGLVHDMAAAYGENRMLLINTSNLDYGAMRPWDLGREAQRASETGKLDRVHKILMASSAIPGAFPAVEIDDHLYADGGVTSNILYSINMDSDKTTFGLWKQRFPDLAIPKVRFWVIVNNQLSIPPAIAQPTWVSVTGLSLSAAIRSQTAMALRHLYSEIKLAREKHHADIEFRYVCIPPDWRAPEEGIFKKKTMDDLAEVGLKMGADPTNWLGEPPAQ